jgi:hypothetical protein
MMTHSTVIKDNKELDSGAHACNSVILAIQEAEIRRIMVGSHLGQIVQETVSQKNPIMKKDW